jgi:hypothetical protein
MTEMTREDIKNIVKFFEILHQIHCRIKLNNPQILPKEANEDVNQNEPTKLHRSKRNR